MHYVTFLLHKPPQSTIRKLKPLLFDNNHVYLCTYNIPKQRHGCKITTRISNRREVRVMFVEAKKEVNNNPTSVRICGRMRHRGRTVNTNINFKNFSLSEATKEQPSQDSHICTAFSQLTILTSETPTPCCPEGTPVWFSTSGKYSGNGRHAGKEKNQHMNTLHAL